MLRRFGIAAVIASLLGPGRAGAVVLAEDELAERSTELAILLRSFAFVFAGSNLRPPVLPVDANPAGSGIFDLRLTFAHRQGGLKIVLANQLVTRAQSHAIGGSLALGRGLPPPRWAPLQVETTTEDGGSFGLRYVLDWAFVAYSVGPLTWTVGRQPVTFGRGTLWRPMDLVSTFALTEVDTEYKPGTDAVRLDWNIAARSVLTLVGAPGELADDHDAEATLRGSSIVARFKHGWDSGEIGTLAGLVRRDVVLGLDGVVDLRRLDLYAAAVVTMFTAGSLSPSASRPAGSAPGDAAVRAVLGARFKPAATLTLTPELYYNGIGAWDAEDYLAVARSERFRIGELYTLGTAYAGLAALWEVHPLVHLNAAAMANLRDPSALLSAAVDYSAASNVAAIAGFYLPVGRQLDVGEPLAPRPRSEFGLYPYFVFFELKVAI